jgi:16S rRNA (guanine527-N7)-methyltransferase
LFLDKTKIKKQKKHKLKNGILYPKGGDLQRVAALPEYNLADF